MKTYKLCRVKDGKLYPMFVNARKSLPIGEWIEAEIGEVTEDGNHVKSRIGNLSLRPGLHTCQVPYTDWMGHKDGEGNLVQRKNTVWVECLVEGNQLFPKGRNGMRTIPEGWYFFKTNQRQIFPWIISGKIFITRIIEREEVENICMLNGVTAQSMEQ